MRVAQQCWWPPPCVADMALSLRLIDLEAQVGLSSAQTSGYSVLGYYFGSALGG
eukprot:COSAG05_NODE_7970_length_750_cov_1.436252_2_plen_53_part_01